MAEGKPVIGSFLITEVAFEGLTLHEVAAVVVTPKLGPLIPPAALTPAVLLAPVAFPDFSLSSFFFVVAGELLVLLLFRFEVEHPFFLLVLGELGHCSKSGWFSGRVFHLLIRLSFVLPHADLQFWRIFLVILTECTRSTDIGALVPGIHGMVGSAGSVCTVAVRGAGSGGGGGVGFVFGSVALARADEEAFGRFDGEEECW